MLFVKVAAVNVECHPTSVASQKTCAVSRAVPKIKKMLKDLLDSVPVNYQESRSKKGEVTLNCPFCEERGENADHRLRLGLNLDIGKGHCFNCEWRSNSYAFTLRELCRIYGIRRRLSMRMMEPVPVKEKVPEITGLPPGYETFTVSGDWFEKEARIYLQQRGITRLQIQRHKIGYATAGPFAGRIIFPVIGRGKAVYGCVSRAVRNDVIPKYLNTPGIKILWNAYRKAHTAIVVEGIMDALSVERALGPGQGVVAVARLGSAITRLQLKQLNRYEEVVIFPDWDEAGVQGAVKLATMLLDVGKQAKICVPKVMNDQDPGSMLPEEINAEIARAIPWNRNTERRLRIAASKSA